MSGAYRALVAVTARSRFAMFAFTASVMVALPLLGTKLIMGATNPEQDTERENVEDESTARGFDAHAARRERGWREDGRAMEVGARRAEVSDSTERRRVARGGFRCTCSC
ncbi:hypothetical protein BE221DRAFT_70722 [Ostreococcus tauri]|uniref:Uncharacterized protein n=1 Tax=Ostreococcus tauri TaxID=70448 RepID=A0A1Y5IJ13_OSTTA|nr:hypothetical protein BE221DRAFT_70722 [Ostreococcus tauri]